MYHSWPWSFKLAHGPNTQKGPIAVMFYAVIVQTMLSLLGFEKCEPFPSEVDAERELVYRIPHSVRPLRDAPAEPIILR